MSRTAALLFAALLPGASQAQSPETLEACAAVKDNAQRLACYDDKVRAGRPAASPAAPGMPAQPAAPAPTTSAEPPKVATGERRGIRLTTSEGCHEPQHSELTRFWELETRADCGTFGIRGYRPISLALVGADSVNEQPTSGNPANNATTSTDYRTTELRLNLSVRTKIAQGLFTYGDDGLDSVWVAYSQQSYWQLFTPQLSRPFRSTDHEPEIMYIRPLQSEKAGEWRLRVGGLGLVHQSNGQSLPLSRSWNRVYLMAAAERDNLRVTARLWHRLDEKHNDDNPGISDFIGRGELTARWQATRENLFALTARHALRKDGHGSVRLEWFRSLADTGWGLPSGLRLHTQLFSGYGDTLIDYNQRRNVFSVGLSLVEW
jgi:phospholipase A1